MSHDSPRLTRRQAGTLIASLAAGLLRPGAAFAADPANAGDAANPGRWGPPRAFSWEWLVGAARERAARPFEPRQPSASAVPDWDSFVRLTYASAEALTGTVRLFPTRREVAPYAVGIHVVEHGMARELLDTQGLFGADGKADPAGWRVLDPSGRTDWMAFLGASYFRCSGTENRYGLSARGIAVDTGLPGAEEFPAFTDFWIQQHGDDHVVVHALLDGPSLSGAYEIDTRWNVGKDMVQEVRCALFPRRAIQRLGIAPQTSMFLYDQTRADGMPRAHPIGDWRPEVHDSDGLAIWSGNGEHIWRPLHNPQAARMHSFRADHPRAFGLLQRDRHFDHYEDDQLFYDRRPSLWVQPRGDWGTGSVMLYEMASISETVDNIGAFWVSDAPVRAGQRRDMAYRLTWTSADPSTDANAHCANILIGPAGPTDTPPDPATRKYVLDFAGPVLAGLGEGSGVRALSNLPASAILNLQAHPIDGRDARWRVTLDMRVAGLAQKDFRVFLQRGSQALSETVVVTLER
ncbi:glucan biosynthesis protein D [Thiomonas sp. FB-6]|uniref:glucan biosynthesis protein D n=1 Tax=Thiomonas sp. FB-6 TaxID=1158291 RepID=UPI000370280E|nr:glucan biosynthesis protein D [Thiomonas sp. FB-6]